MFAGNTSREIDLPIMPVLPVLGGRLSLYRKCRRASILDHRKVYKVTSGGAAIYLALKSLGVQAGDEVLIPSYHCPAMVEPVINIGAKPVFYFITEDIGLDYADIKRKISKNTKAILVPHFFGIRQNLGELKTDV